MANELVILNPTVMGWEHQRQFFGDIFHYQTVANVTIAGNVLDLHPAKESSAVIWAGINEMLNSSQDFSAISINNIDLGSGRINSFTWEEGVDVMKKGYQMSLTVYEEGDLSNLDTTGEFYEGLEGGSGNFKLIDKLEENFDYSNSETDVKKYTHSINLRVHSGININPITIAKGLAETLRSKNEFLGIFATGSNQYYKGWSGQYFKTYVESYNMITNECSFTENWEFNNPSGKYSIIYTHQIQTNEEGVTSVSENGKIEGLVFDYYTSAQEGLTAQKALAGARISAIFNNYKPANCYGLNTNPIARSYQSNKNLAEINYVITYDNDTRHSGDYTWEYTDELSVSEDNIYQLSENGNIVGFGRKGPERYNQALAGYNTAKAGIFGRLDNLYSGTNQLLNISSSVQKSEFEGKVGYSETYTDNSKILSGAFLKVDINIDDTLPLRQLNKFNIVNYKEIVQSPDVFTLGNRSCSVNIIGKRTTTMDTFLAKALETGFAPYSGIGYDSYVVNKEYSITSGTAPVQFSFKADIVFHSGHV